MGTEVTTEKKSEQNAPAPFTPLGADTAPSTETKQNIAYVDQGWSWGAFMLSWKFAIAIREYKYLFLLLFMIIPVVNFFVLIGAMIYFGVKGRELARQSKTFANHDEYLGFMKGIDHLGKVMAYIALVACVIGLLIAGIIFSFVLSILPREGDAFSNQSYEIQHMMERETVR